MLGAFSKGLILRDAYRIVELGLQSYIGCVGVFRMVLNLYIAKLALSRVISGGNLLSGRARGRRLLYFWMYIFPGGCTKGRYRCNNIDVLDAVLLAGLWRQRGETGLRIVILSL